MSMIPGAWEARPRAATAQPSRASVSAPPFEKAGGHDSGPAPSADNEQAATHGELPGWIRVSIFAGTLLAATWIAMAMYF